MRYMDSFSLTWHVICKNLFTERLVFSSFFPFPKKAAFFKAAFLGFYDQKYNFKTGSHEQANRIFHKNRSENQLNRV